MEEQKGARAPCQASGAGPGQGVHELRCVEALVVEISSGGFPDEGSTHGLGFDHGTAGVEEAVGGFGEFPALGQAFDNGSVDAAQGGESHVLERRWASLPGT